jgi:pyrroline-5-carboxylate reductase
MKLLMIGCGNMGGAIVSALLKKGEASPVFSEVMVYDVNEDKMQRLAAHGATPSTSLEAAKIDDETFVVIAVKPQYISPVLDDLRPLLQPQTVVISIAAGISLNQLHESLGHDRLVRVMPNTPALVNAGASGWFAMPTVSAEQREQVQAMLSSFGVAVEVPTEDQIDAVTALSGSGPAYVFFFMEQLVKGGIELGLSEETAYSLAQQTVLGAAQLADQQAGTLEDLQQLRTNVTSKGGTTEAALNQMGQDDFPKLIEDAMRAAYQRAKTLADPSSQN